MDFSKAFPHWKQLDCPYGKIGDRLWVRETFALRYSILPHRKIEKYFYRADGEYEGKLKWKPSIFMPRSASRINLEITNVRVERLQEITDTDCLNEGMVMFWKKNPSGIYQYGVGKHWFDYPDDAFQCLWNSINGKDSWESNPWVWVIEFKRVA